MRWINRSRGFTLIELLIVIAIILILIAIALPNFLEAQARAKVTRTKADMRGLGTAIEAFRTERGVLLVDFWDDGTLAAFKRWETGLAKIGRAPGPGATYQWFEECFFPLTSPAKYIQSVPLDMWSQRGRPVGFSAGEQGDGYIYFDNDEMFKKSDDHGIDRFNTGSTLGRLSQTQPLREGEFGIISVGPDTYIGTSRGGDFRGMAYSATNGTMSKGDLIYRSAGTND
jgi:general secretion pathway protein G